MKNNNPTLGSDDQFLKFTIKEYVNGLASDCSIGMITEKYAKELINSKYKNYKKELLDFANSEFDKEVDRLILGK